MLPPLRKDNEYVDFLPHVVFLRARLAMEDRLRLTKAPTDAAMLCSVQLLRMYIRSYRTLPTHRTPRYATL